MRLALVTALRFLLTGCGQFFVGFVSNPGGSPVHVTGTIIVVHVGFIDDSHGTVVTFTAVTFANAGADTTVNFCGDLSSDFQIGQMVRVDFSTGFYCSKLIALTVQH